MKTHTAIFNLIVLFATASPLLAKTEQAHAKPRVEVCFVLDTTSSMAGLIEGAKQKIWSIANEIVGARPVPELKVGLVAYRDRGDDYVVKTFPLTDDVDAIYAQLSEFKAQGGGDTPESVNEALDAAVNQMKWSEDSKVLKIIFLVGDAPPHMDYQDGPKYPKVCENAVKKNLLINSIQCGNIIETKSIWEEIAKLSEGSFAAIAQTGNVAVIATPMDGKLAELNRKIGDTLIPYGSAAVQKEVLLKQANAVSASAPAAADRLAYNAVTRKAVQGGGELLGALAEGTVKMDSIEAKDLPAEMQGLGNDELRRRIDGKQKERASFQKQIEELTKERAAFIQAETKRMTGAGKGDSFDEKVAEIIRSQAASKGITYSR